MAGYIVPEIEDKGLNGSDIAVWAALCRFAQWDYIDGEPAKSKDGSCYPSIQAITEKSHIAQSTVCDSLKRLENFGYITRSRKNHGVSYNLFAEKYRANSDNQNLKFRQPEVKIPIAGISDENLDEPIPIAGSQNSDDRNLKFRQPETNNIYNNPINKPEEGDPSERVSNSTEQDMNAEKLLNALRAKSKRKPNQRPLPNVPYDHNALGALTEMYELVPDYVADMPHEIRFLQELAQEYPDADLFRQFRRARDWLSQCKKPKKDLLRFLRNWIAHGEKYGENKRDESDYEYTSVFVPVNDDT